MSKHIVKENYNKIWNRYCRFVKMWQSFSNEAIDSQHNQEMSQRWSTEIMPQLDAIESLAKMLGIKTNPREAVWN